MVSGAEGRCRIARAWLQLSTGSWRWSDRTGGTHGVQPGVEERGAACGRGGGRKREKAWGWWAAATREGGRDLRVIWSLYL